MIPPELLSAFFVLFFWIISLFILSLVSLEIFHYNLHFRISGFLHMSFVSLIQFSEIILGLGTFENVVKFISVPFFSYTPVRPQCK